MTRHELRYKTMTILYQAFLFPYIYIDDALCYNYAIKFAIDKVEKNIC